MSTSFDDDESSSPPQSPQQQPPQAKPKPLPSKDVISDVCLWRNKKLSLSVLGASTVIWFVLEVLGYTFLTVASWDAIAMLTTLFLWSNLAPLFGKDPPEMFDWEISAQTAIEKANAVRLGIEDSIRRLIRIIEQRDWSMFAQFMTGLVLASWFGSWFDLLTLLYIGVLVGLTCPPIYVKYEDRIKGYAEIAKEQGERWWSILRVKGQSLSNQFDEKVLKRMRKRVPKEKKDE